jgi:hypothetical protein
MISIDRLNDLRKRAEKATEGSGDLDREMAIALGWTPPTMGLPYWHDHEGNHWTALPDWSTSIDDAIALVERMLPGWSYSLRRGGRLVQATVESGEAQYPVWALISQDGYGKHVDAPTPPLAVILALLTALSHTQEPNSAA